MAFERSVSTMSPARSLQTYNKHLFPRLEETKNKSHDDHNVGHKESDAGKFRANNSSEMETMSGKDINDEEQDDRKVFI
jgi:hypothetical protein